MKQIRIVIAAVILMLPFTANATLIFDNGNYSESATQIQRNYNTPFTMWEDFVLGSNAILSEIRWGGGEYQTSGTSVLSSTNLTIYDGLPGVGSIIFSQSFTPNSSFIANVGNVGRYDYSISGLNLALTAGNTYWFGLNNTAQAVVIGSNTIGTASTIAGLYQSQTALPGAFFGDQNGAFQLYDNNQVSQVPEPSIIALLGLALLD